MPDVTVERRNATRHDARRLAAEVVKLPRGARRSARTSDVSRTGATWTHWIPFRRVRKSAAHHSGKPDLWGGTEELCR